MRVSVCVCVCILQQLIFAKKTNKMKEKEKLKTKKKYLQLLPLSCCLLANHWPSGPKTGLEKLKNPQKLGLKHSKRVDVSKHVEKRATHK